MTSSLDQIISSKLQADSVMFYTGCAVCLEQTAQRADDYYFNQTHLKKAHAYAKKKVIDTCVHRILVKYASILLPKMSLPIAAFEVREKQTQGNLSLWKE